jgi:hypothetical protein
MPNTICYDFHISTVLCVIIVILKKMLVRDESGVFSE